MQTVKKIAEVKSKVSAWTIEKLLKVMRSSEWRWFSKNVLSKLHLRFAGHPKFPMADYHLVADLLRSNNENSILTFSSMDTSSLGSILIKAVVEEGDFTHAGIVFFSPSSGANPQILHMTSDGVVIEDLLNLLRSVDYICFNRVSLTSEDLKTARDRIQWIMDNRDKLTYDFAQSLDTSDKMYCSEADYFVLKGLTDDIDLRPTKVMGVNAFPPDSVAKVGEVIYSNHPKFKGEL